MNTNNLPPVNESDEPRAAAHRHKYTLFEYLDVYSRFSKRKKRNRKKIIAEEKRMTEEMKPKVNNAPLSSIQKQKIFVIIMIFVCTALILATLVIFAASSFISPMFESLLNGDISVSGTPFEWLEGVFPFWNNDGPGNNGDDGKYSETLTMTNGTVVSRVPTIDKEALTFTDSANIVALDPEKVASNYAILIDPETNEVVAALSPDERIYPASMTKVMTLIIACENISSLTDKIVFTEDAIEYAKETGASNAGFDAGDETTVEALLYAISLESCAQSTIALADNLAGSTYAFTSRMNEKVEELGLENTHFSNPIGLEDELNYTTPREMAMIMKYALSNELCRKLLTAKTYIAPTGYYKESGEYANINHYFYSGLFYGRLELNRNQPPKPVILPSGVEILGGKTGYETTAKYCLASVALAQSGKEYILVTAAAEKRGEVDDLNYIYGEFAK